MPNLNKKGISDVVGTTLIVLLTIVAMGLVWSYISAIISPLDSQLSPLPDCLQFRAAQNACYGDGELRLSTSSPDKINTLKLVTGAQTFDCNPKATNTATCGPNKCIPQIAKGQAQTLYVNLAVRPQEITVVYNDCTISQRTVQVSDCA